MSDSINSTNWIGPPAPPAPAWERRLFGEGISLEDAHIIRARAQGSFANTSPEAKRLRRAAALLFLSPVSLWAFWKGVQVAIPDALWVDQKTSLVVPAFVVIVIAVLEFRSTSLRRARFRTIAMYALSVLLLAYACLYGYAAIDGHRHAVAMRPSRTFEIWVHRYRASDFSVHQLADGRTLEGISVGPSRAYATTCAEAQHLVSANGFVWVRVLERSPTPGSEIFWPIRREDCFSDQPLHSLRT
jgi:hypothetical protein